MTVPYIAYSLSGFIWGVYFRNFFFSGFFLYLFQVSFFFIFGQGSVTSYEYWVFMPLTFFLFCLESIFMQYVINSPKLLPIASFSRELYIIKILIQIIVLHAIMSLLIIGYPWSLIIMFFIYLAVLIVIWFINKSDFMWTNCCKNIKHGCSRFCTCSTILYTFFTAYFISIIFAYLIVILINDNIWPFWILSSIWLIHTVLLILKEILLPPRY